MCTRFVYVLVGCFSLLAIATCHGGRLLLCLLSHTTLRDALFQVQLASGQQTSSEPFVLHSANNLVPKNLVGRDGFETACGCVLS